MAVTAFRLFKSTSLRWNRGLCRKHPGGVLSCQGANLLGVWHRSELASSRHTASVLQSRHLFARTHWSVSRPSAAGPGAAAAAAAAAASVASAAAPAAEAAVPTMDEDICSLIQQIHDSPTQAVLHATGGGFQVCGQAACVTCVPAWPAATAKQRQGRDCAGVVMAADGAWRITHGAGRPRAVCTAGPGRVAGGCSASLIRIAANCTGHGDGRVSGSRAGRHVRHAGHRPGLQLCARHRPPQARGPQGELPGCTSHDPC